MRYLLFILIFVSSVANAQPVDTVTYPQLQPFGNVKSLYWYKGAVQIDKDVYFRQFYGSDTTKVLGFDSKGRLVLRTNSGGGGGTTDSNIFAPNYRVDTAKRNIRLQIYQVVTDTANGLRGYVNALFTNYYTQAQVNTLLTNYYTKSQSDARYLQGYTETDPVWTAEKASYLTIVNGNALYVPKTRALTINGVTQDLTADRTWTIPGTDSTIFTTEYRRKRDSIALSIAIANVDTLIPDGLPLGFSDANFNNAFVVEGTVIPRVSNSYSYGSPILWTGVLGGDHASNLIDSIYGDANGRLAIRCTNARYVMSGAMNNDETSATRLLFIGPSVSSNNAAFNITRSVTVGQKLTGNGTQVWSQQAPAYLQISNFNQFGDYRTFFNIADISTPRYTDLAIKYNGYHNYNIVQSYSGTGSYNVAFWIVDAYGNIVTENPSSTDEIVITPLGNQYEQIRANIWDLNNSFLASGSLNFWATIKMIFWMVASPLTQHSNLVKWSTDYPSATNYKIFRNGSLVHTGNEGRFVDTGLNAGTVYKYELYAVIGGVDNYISYFYSPTKK